MEYSLPVPSKNALRALRHLALATSCTIAFGAGVVTADRRGRIQSAHQVCENARRIKASRSYCNAGITISTLSEGQIESYYQNGPWSGSQKERLLENQSNGTSTGRVSQALVSRVKTKRNVHSQGSVPKAPIDLAMRTVGGKPRYSKSPRALIPTSNHLCNKPTTQASSIRPARQIQLAREALNHLRNGSNLDMHGKATATLSRAFSGRHKRHTKKSLLKAYILLGQTCERLNSFNFYVPVLKHILAHERIDEQTFCALHATNVLAYLLEGNGLASTKLEKFEDAVTIFCTTLWPQPLLTHSMMLKIGTQLFNATTQARLYHLSGHVLEHMAFMGANSITRAVEIIILDSERKYRKTMARNDNEQLLYHFIHLFSKTKPNQTSFYRIVAIALQAAFDVMRLDRAEKIFLMANHMTKDGGLRLSTTWMLRILSHQWRATHDLASTEALFDRLESTIQNTSHPVAVYNAMSQFCIEAGNEVKLLKYLNCLKEKSSAGPSTWQMCGNLALAKAKKGDWSGVENCFKCMQLLSPNPSKQAALFVPVLKEFAASHKPAEVEKFLQFYVEKLGIVPSQYIFNTMISVYCRAKEIDCVARWIQFAQTLGLEIDVASFNIILFNCQRRWAVPFAKLYRLCTETAAAKDGMIDGTTIRILHNAALSSAGKDTGLKAELLSKVASLQQSSGCHIPDEVEIAFRDALADGKPNKAKEVYKHHVGNTIPSNRRVATLAVRASIEASVNKGLKPAIELINQARALNINIFPALIKLLVHEMEAADGKDLQSIAIRTLISLEAGGFEISLGAATKILSILVDRGRKMAAIELWTSLSARYENIRKSVDIILLTVLLKAYVQLFDCHGIRWVMDVLTLKNITPDKRFKGVLKTARAAARRSLKVKWSKDVQIRYTLLDDSVQRVAGINVRNKKSEKYVEAKFFSILNKGAVIESKKQALGAPLVS